MRTILSISLAALVALPAPAAPAPPSHHAVAADHPLAEKAGLAILDQGGNAVDAAVATSFALAVVRPESCGIGGGGFMVIHLTDDPRTPEPADIISLAIDYRERAPQAITPTTFADLPPDASITSGLAVAVPGTVAGLLHAHERFGILPRAAVLAPAIALARAGYTLDAHAARAADVLAEEIASPRPDTHARLFLARYIPKNPDRSADTRVMLPELAATLEAIAESGRDAFYTGPIAQAIVDTVAARAGVMTLDDLASFRPIEAEPLRIAAMDRTFLTMPLPSSGGVTLAQALKTVEERRDLLANMKFGTPGHHHVVAEALKLAMADRARFLADPESTSARAEPMLDPARIRDRALAIRLNTALPHDDPAVLAPLPDDAGTSHLCVVDRHGNAVACTETVNLEYGSRIPVVAHGFFLNNEMDDFLTAPGRPNAFTLTQAEANLPGPRKRPLSSMSPTIALDHRGDVRLVIGASGGPRIISATLQVIVAIAHYRLDARTAVDAPRIHHQWTPDTVFWEADRPLRDDAMRGLRDRGHTLQSTTSGAAVQCIERDPTDPSRWHAIADPRKRNDAKAPTP